MNQGYELKVEVPTVSDYCRLRSNAGLSPRSEIAAQAGLPNSVVAVIVKHKEHVVGMGRVVGDGLFYQVVDIALEPAHQGRGLGKDMVARLMQELQRIAPSEAYVSLIADGKANRLYRQYGFEPTAPTSIGMARWIGEK